MTKRTIWVLNKYASGHEDGFETRTMAISREWAKAGHHVVVFCSNANHLTGNRDLPGAAEDRSLDGVRVIRLRTLRYVRTASARRVLSWIDFEWRLLRARIPGLFKPDIIIVSSLSLLTVISGLVLARRHACRWVFEVRDIWPLTLVEEGGISRWHPLALVLKAIERLGYGRADLIVGTMPNLVSHVRRTVRRPVPVAHVPFGFEPASAPGTLPGRATTDSPRTMIVGYAGSVGISNALDTLIECAVLLRDDPRFRFVIAGDGDRRSSLMRRTHACPLVTWLGRIPRQEVHRMLSSCDLLYFAAQQSKVWEYGLSLNKLTDYMLAARPILGSYSGFPTILHEANCGRFVPANDVDALLDALIEFHEMPSEVRSAMGFRGRTWLFEHRTWARLADDYLLLLEQLLARQGIAASTPRV